MTEYKFICEKCQYRTNLKSLIDQHYNTVLHKTGKHGRRETKEKNNYKCQYCSYETSNKNNYLTHTLNNHESLENRKKTFKYYCECCNVGVFTKSAYNKHQQTNIHQRKSTTTLI